MKKLWFLAALWIAVSGCAKEGSDQVVAVVGDRDIPLSEVNENFMQVGRKAELSYVNKRGGKVVNRGHSVWVYCPCFRRVVNRVHIFFLVDASRGCV